ncbi:MAG: phosphotransferase [Deltaproteobacteria bacterium]|nr:phosphotransferase [Deltaproteobacteria bacterium]
MPDLLLPRVAAADDDRIGEVGLILAAHYDLGQVLRSQALTGGRINRTWRVDTDRGAYVVQRLHPVFGGDGHVVENARRVTDHLAAKGILAPQIVPAGSGRTFVSDQETRLWRVMTFIQGNPAPDRTPKTVFEAGRVLGKWHRVMSDNPPELLSVLPAAYMHGHPLVAVQFQQAVKKYLHTDKYRHVQEIIAALQDRPADWPGRNYGPVGVVHGDPKWENILLDAFGRGLCLVDLDTIHIGFPVLEVADGLRSWSAQAGQEPLALDLLEAGLAGYIKEVPELAHSIGRFLVAGLKRVVLELILRYLTDYFEESYFFWDRSMFSSLAEQNLAQALARKAVLDQIMIRENDILQMVARLTRHRA